MSEDQQPESSEFEKLQQRVEELSQLVAKMQQTPSPTTPPETVAEKPKEAPLLQEERRPEAPKPVEPRKLPEPPPKPFDSYDPQTWGKINQPPLRNFPLDPYDPSSGGDPAHAPGPDLPPSEPSDTSIRLEAMDARLAETEKRLNDIWPPRPASTSGDSAGGGGTFAATVHEDGGDAGDSANPCTFTYTVTDALSGVVRGTHIPMHGNGRRDAVGKMTAGSKGIYFMDHSVCRLIFVDESNPRIIRECDT